MPYPSIAATNEDAPLIPRTDLGRRHSFRMDAVSSFKRPDGPRVSSYFSALMIAAGLIFVWAGLCLT
jgi:hypothetical protein